MQRGNGRSIISRPIATSRIRPAVGICLPDSPGAPSAAPAWWGPSSRPMGAAPTAARGANAPVEACYFGVPAAQADAEVLRAVGALLEALINRDTELIRT